MGMRELHALLAAIACAENETLVRVGLVESLTGVVGAVSEGLADSEFVKSLTGVAGAERGRPTEIGFAESFTGVMGAENESLGGPDIHELASVSTIANESSGAKGEVWLMDVPADTSNTVDGDDVTTVSNTVAVPDAAVVPNANGFGTSGALL
jgi:hypothetical protein